jgi:glycosyltransferase involved in cell wall biosynthesis
MRYPFFFWQVSLSPHMHSLYQELSALGISVTVITYRNLSLSRTALGWTSPIPDSYTHIHSQSIDRFLSLHHKLARNPFSVHFYQGIYGNNVLSSCLKNRVSLAFRSTCVIMSEPPDLHGLVGFLRAFLFRFRLAKIEACHRTRSSFLLALGGGNPFWDRLIAGSKIPVISFGYFLSHCLHSNSLAPTSSKSSLIGKLSASTLVPAAPCSLLKFNISFVGQCISRKNILLLARVLASLDKTVLSRTVFHLAGSGPHVPSVCRFLQRASVETVFYGVIPQSDIQSFFSFIDLLILPSAYDGWGMVAQEALLSGSRAIVSANCGIHPYLESFENSKVWDGCSKTSLRKLVISSVELGSVSPSERALNSTNASSVFSASLHARRLVNFLIDYGGV